MKRNNILLLLLIIAFTVVASYLSHAANRPVTSDSVGAYYSGVYSNLFVELLGNDASIVREKVDSAFQKLFYGDDKNERVYYPVGSDMAYIEDINNKDVRTEGMSYGMMICVQWDKKTEFDRLWKWARTYMQFQSGPHAGYFAWHCTTAGTILDATAASDGEEWFVTSLFFAAARWGSGEGIYDYRHEAEKILNTMLHKESESDHGDVTDMFDRKEHLVAFVPNQFGARFTDPSYQLPHYYELWARWASRDNQFWCDAAVASRELLFKSADSTTGLSPDYCRFDGRPVGPWAGEHNDFRFDAWRVAMNVALDYQWFAKDKRQVAVLNRLLDFFYAQGVGKYANQYTLQGKSLSNDHSTGLVAMNAVAALVSTNEHRSEFVKDLWNARIPTGPYRYYDGMLYTLAMLQVSGNFKIYHPTRGPVPACSDK